MKNKPYILLALVAALLLTSLPSGAQIIAVKANALSWAACTPDIGVEITTGEHTSVALSAFGHYKPYGVESKAFAVQPEFRYWFNGRPLTREYIGAAAGLFIYDSQLFNQVFRGDAISLGITGGYVFSLGKRWAFELSAGVGLLAFRHKQYDKGDNYDDYSPGSVMPVNNWGYTIFPTKLNASFIYIIR